MDLAVKSSTLRARPQLMLESQKLSTCILWHPATHHPPILVLFGILIQHNPSLVSTLEGNIWTTDLTVKC